MEKSIRKYDVTEKNKQASKQIVVFFHDHFNVWIKPHGSQL